MDGLEQEIKLVRQQLGQMDNKKMNKVKKLLDMLNKEVPTILTSEVDEVLNQQIKSMRKLPLFGCTNAKVDFEWPTA